MRFFLFKVPAEKYCDFFKITLDTFQHNVEDHEALERHRKAAEYGRGMRQRGEVNQFKLDGKWPAYSTPMPTFWTWGHENPGFWIYVLFETPSLCPNNFGGASRS